MAGNFHVALLRAVNVGGTGKLPMAELRAMCEGLGFTDVRTYIASGNVVFRADGDAKAVKAALEAALATYAGKPVGVMVRCHDELIAVLASNPFSDAAGNRLLIVFLDEPPPPDALSCACNLVGERLALGKREIYIHYAAGMGDSKLKLPAAAIGTGRNLNTVTKLAEMSRS